MSYTKKEFIDQAFSEIGLATYTFDMEPEQYQDALRKLDGMMGTWASKGINLGYPIPTKPSESKLNDETNVQEFNNEAIYLNLAVRIARSFGKMVNQDTKIDANKAYKELLRVSIDMTPKQLDNLPRGAGQKSWRYNNYNKFISANRNSVQLDSTGNLNLGE